jgi:hypothetical protein
MRTKDLRQVQLVDCRVVHFNARGDFLSSGRTNEDERAHSVLHDTPPRQDQNRIGLAVQDSSGATQQNRGLPCKTVVVQRNKTAAAKRRTSVSEPEGAHVSKVLMLFA